MEILRSFIVYLNVIYAGVKVQFLYILHFDKGGSTASIIWCVFHDYINNIFIIIVLNKLLAISVGNLAVLKWNNSYPHKLTFIDQFWWIISSFVDLVVVFCNRWLKNKWELLWMSIYRDSKLYACLLKVRITDLL